MTLPIAVLAGVLLVWRLLPGAPILLRLGLGALMGCGIDSLLYLGTLVVGAPSWAVVAVELAGVAAVSLREPLPHSCGSERRGGWPFGAVVMVQMVLALWLFAAETRVNPHGRWDAWSIWNLRARYLSTPETWRYAVSPELILQHPDYPLLTSALIGHSWSDATPAAVALLFALSALAVIAGGTTAGLCGVAALLGAPAWMRLAASQYADVPFSAFFVGALAMLVRARRDSVCAYLAGVCASMAAWTKDEGLVLVLAVVACSALLDLRLPLRCFAGALPVLLVVVAYKTMLAPGLDPLSRQAPAAIATKLADASRYAAVARLAVAELRQLPEMLLAPAFLVALGVRRSREAAACFAVLGTVAAAYFAVYVVTPYPLEWHVTSSAQRLALQLLPGFIFACLAASKQQIFDS